MQHEWVVLASLLGLLLGFAILARQFEDSELPKAQPRFLPSGWVGPLAPGDRIRALDVFAAVCT